MEYILLGILIFIGLYWFFTRNFDHWKNKNVPYIKPVPFFGNMAQAVTMRYSFGEFFQQIYEKTKEPIFGFYILDKPSLLVRDPGIIKKVFITDFQYFNDRNVMDNKRDDPVSSNMLFILKNPEWKEVRTKISPIYTSSKIRKMSKLLEDASQDMVDYLNEEITKKPIICIKDVFIKFTVNVITSTAFGTNANAFKNEKSQFYIEAKRLMNWDDFFTSFRLRIYFVAPFIVKLFRIKFLNPGPVKFLTESFWEILNQRADSMNRRNDLIDALLDMKKENKYFMEGDMLTAQALIFLAAGFETSSSTLGFALYEIAQNLEIQKKLREEIVDISGRFGGINCESLKEMNYLDMCVKESLRKYPVGPFLERKCNTSYTITETGTTLDKETPVFVSVLGLHHDPLYFPNPQVFDPERFSPENKDKIENCTYLPFGEGPRNCIGRILGTMMVKFGIANILKNFVIEVEPTNFKRVAFNKNSLVLSAKPGIYLKMSKI